MFRNYAIINSVVKGDSESVDIQVYDFVKTFDVLWIENSMNDVWKIVFSLIFQKFNF